MITVKINGLDKLIEMADKYPAVAEKHVNKAIQRSLLRVQDSAKQNAPFGTSGNLRSNWILKQGRFSGSLSSGANSAGYPYGSAVEYGTRPHFVSAMALNTWAKRRGLNPFVIARSIGRKGTKANPFFQKSADSQEDNINKEIDQALDAILNEI
jgi:HK97 gp10 family phage protein